MILFLDTEFTTIDNPPDLISLALVNEHSQSDFFYAELPRADYQHAASPWVRNNVLPLLWGGSWAMPMQELSARLVRWIEDQDDRCLIVTDAPEYDFELIKPLLNPWPRNLSRQPMRFDSLAMGVNRQAWLVDVRRRFHTKEQPAHHALCDAQALRETMMAALAAGWQPLFG